MTTGGARDRDTVTTGALSLKTSSGRFSKLADKSRHSSNWRAMSLVASGLNLDEGNVRQQNCFEDLEAEEEYEGYMGDSVILHSAPVLFFQLCQGST